jgi:hypothetical protein
MKKMEREREEGRGWTLKERKRRRQAERGENIGGWGEGCAHRYRGIEYRRPCSLSFEIHTTVFLDRIYPIAVPAVWNRLPKTL